MNATPARPCTHEEAFDLIPWSINGRIQADDQQRLQRHLLDCAACRQELAEQQRVRDAVRRESSNIEYAPQASLQKLMARIDASEASSVADPAQDLPNAAVPIHVQSVERFPARRWMMAAALVVAVGTGALLNAPWQPTREDSGAAYRTVTSPPAEPFHAGQVRAVFAPNVTVEELTRIVSETRLSIVDGPSDSGVYTLGLQNATARSIDDVVKRLRSDPRVRFAEPVVAESR